MKAFNLRSIIENKKELFLYLVIILLTLISSQYIYFYLIYCGPGRGERGDEIVRSYQLERTNIQELILAGNAPAHIQYRILKPAAIKLVQILLSPFIKDTLRTHLYASRILIFLVFLFTYYFFGKFLRIFYSPEISIAGLLLLQVIIPLSIEPNPNWAEGNFYNLMFYALGLYLMFRNKEQYLPLVVLFATLNREHFIFFNVFYGIYLVYQKRLFTKKGITLLAVNTAVWLAVYLGLRFYFGFKPNYSTISFEVMGNLANWWGITQLWGQEVLIFVILCIIVYKRSNRFFQYSFLSLGLYTILFFLNGHMNELMKFLPAYLIMIPMCLKILEGDSERETASSAAG